MKNYLIVVDMQVDFVDGSLGTKEAVEILPLVKEKIESFEGEIIYTRDTHFENYLETQEGRNLPVPHCIKETDGWQIHQSLRHLVGSNICDKYTFGAKELPQMIEELNIAHEEMRFTIIGLCTDICVINNAMILKAYFPESYIEVDAKCCAGVTLETHENALQAMSVCQINILD